MGVTYWPITGAQGPAGPAGATGATGATGAAGTPGSVWYNGAGAPGGGTGIVGDYYIDNSSKDYYTKTGVATWTLLGNLSGGGGSGDLTGGGSWITDGTNFYGPLFVTSSDPTVPLVATWSWVNQGGSTAVDVTGGGISLQVASAATVNFRGLFRTQPATPYVANFLVRGNVSMLAPAETFGAYFYDGTKLMSLEVVGVGGVAYIRVQKLTNVTTDFATAASFQQFPTGIPAFQNMWLRLANDGVNLTFSFSLDGTDYTTIFSEAIGTFITPTEIGFGGLTLNSTQMPAIVLLEGYYTT